MNNINENWSSKALGGEMSGTTSYKKREAKRIKEEIRMNIRAVKDSMSLLNKVMTLRVDLECQPADSTIMSNAAEALQVAEIELAKPIAKITDMAGKENRLEVR